MPPHKQLFPHPVPGDNNRIHGLALTAVRVYSIAMRKLLEIGWQFATVFEVNPASIIYARYSDDLAVRRSEAGIPTIGCHEHEQLVDDGNLNCAPLIDLECFSVFRGNATLLASAVSRNDGFSIRTHHLDRFVFRDAFDGAMKHQPLAWKEVACIAFLR